MKLLIKVYKTACLFVLTPLEKKAKFAPSGETLANVNEYRKFIGELMKVCNTRPAIAFVTSALSRVKTGCEKRVVRYLKFSSLCYTKCDRMSIAGYSDSDRGGCIVDRKRKKGILITVN